MNYVRDLQSEGVLSSATRKLPMNMKTKWLAHARQNDNYYMGLEAFSLWLQEVAAVQEDGSYDRQSQRRQIGMD